MTNRITPETVVEAFRETGATPVTCMYGYNSISGTWGDECCALGAIGKQQGIAPNEDTVFVDNAIRQALGLSFRYQSGLELGWDSPELPLNTSQPEDFNVGYNDGKAARRAIEDAGYTVERG